jgi:DNA mismatch endonuclease (patch repair protein)
MTVDELRSRTMRAIRSKNTKPELVVRRLVHAMGFRFRLHRKDLPGSPDLVFPSRRKIIFVHGCFWHGHDCVRGARQPKTNAEYWIDKITKNHMRDNEAYRLLADAGWTPCIIWECELRDGQDLRRKIETFLDDRRAIGGDG